MSLALLGALYLVPTMIQTDIHDKQAIRVSHFSIFNNIENGFYPPRDLVFPDHPLRYHYGVDTMAAMVAALCHARVDVAFDIVTFVGFAFAIAAFGGVGRSLFGPRGQLFTGFLCCFHGGFPWPYAKPNQELQERLMGLYFGVQGHWLAPPSTSTVFQMPWSAGYPLFALVLLITTQLSPTRLNIFSSIALTLTLCAVSFCQIAVFLSLGGALLGYLLLLSMRGLVKRSPERRARNYLAPIVAVLVSVLTASLISGFAQILIKTEGHVIIRAVGGIAGDLYSNLKWNWGSFGILIPAALLGLFFTPTLTVLFLAHAVGCLLIVNTYKYAHTWDIIKFAFAGEVSLALLSAALTWKLWCGGPIKKSISLVLTALIAAPAILYHVPYWRQMPPKVPIFDPVLRGTWQRLKGFQVSTDELHAISWLRPRVKEREIVLRRMPFAESYIFLGGLPVFQPDDLTISFNNPPSRIQHRKDVEYSKPLDIQQYLAEGVRWLVIDTAPADQDPFFSLANAWEAQGKAIKEVSFNNISVFRLLD
jgi:hypothetical protein